MKKVLMVWLLSFISQFVHAQSKAMLTYKRESEAMRKEVWSWNDPKFKVRDIPGQYQKASKVVIAYHTELSGEAKSRISLAGDGWSFKSNQSFIEIVRQVIKLNDKNAVSEYSEFSFTQFTKTRNLANSFDRMRTFVGVRVIKPGGNIIEINADDIVLTKDETTEKRAKIAIPDLQPGDIIDFFYASVNNTVEDFDAKNYNLVFSTSVPILNYSLHGDFSKKYSIEYSIHNGAPELRLERDKSGGVVFNVEKVNIDPEETVLWIVPERQLQIIRLSIIPTIGRNSVVKHTDNHVAFETLSGSLSQDYFLLYEARSQNEVYKRLLENAKLRAKQNNIDFNLLSESEKAAFLFYCVRFDFFLQFSPYAQEKFISIGDRAFDNFFMRFFGALKMADLNPALLVSASNRGFKMNEIVSLDDFMVQTYLPSSNRFFAMKSIYDVPFAPLEESEGVNETKKFTFRETSNFAMGPNKASKLSQITDGIVVPVSNSFQNSRLEKLILNLAPDQGALSTKRTTVLKGYYKADVQKQLILFEDFYDHERLALKESKTIFDKLNEEKDTRKYIEEVKNAFAEARKKQKEAVINEVKNWFEQDITDLKDFKIINPGVRHTAPDFIYSSSFQLNGLVKKAGNNFIIEIGKIQGQPLAVKEEQRNRTLDVYMPYARSIEYEIELAIPEGYTAEGVEALNSKVENETGFFITEATTDGKTVFIKIKKHYLHNFEPAANFSKLTAFMDASVNWTNAKLLFKKK